MDTITYTPSGQAMPEKTLPIPPEAFSDPGTSLYWLGGGGALAYFKLVKGKQASTRGSADLDDYDYGEDEEDADVEPDEPETEDEEL